MRILLMIFSQNNKQRSEEFLYEENLLFRLLDYFPKEIYPSIES